MFSRAGKKRKKTKGGRVPRTEAGSAMAGDSLKHFVLRSHALKLFRDFARTAKRLPSR